MIEFISEFFINRLPEADFYTSRRIYGTVCSVYLGSKKFGKQIDYAVKDGYTHVLIMGASEYEAGEFKLKDLTARTEMVYPLSALEDEAMLRD